VAALGGAVPVGRFGEWTVAAGPLAIDQWPTPAAGQLGKGTKTVVLGAMDLGDAVGVAAASARGKMTPLMWSAGWRRPTSKLADRRSRVGWEEGAKELAKMAGLSGVAKELGALRNPGDGQRESLDRMVTGAMQLLGIPSELRGVHSGDLGPLTNVVWG
jgi:hypothetical protein